MTIRVLMKISEKSHPELYAELSDIDPRKRGERLRLLSTMQLQGSEYSADGISTRPPAKKRQPKRPTKRDEQTLEPKDKGAQEDSIPPASRQADAHATLRSSLLSGMKKQF